jgi:predicted regulator of Ras-like GTPase activity (Roadblock/LC7/MglB family)
LFGGIKYNMQAEGVIIFDELIGKIIFSEVPPKFSTSRQTSVGGMLINLVKKFSNEFEAGEVKSIVISSEKKIISISKREHKYLIVLFPITTVIEHNVILQKTEEIFNAVIKNG